MRPDSELIREYAEQHSERAFTELVERYVPFVYATALRVVVDAHLAEDVTQTTFSLLAREARSLAGRSVLSGWLHRTATNQAAKLVRGEMRRRAREQEAYSVQTTPSEPEPDWSQLAPVLDAALNKLDEADRTAIFLRFFEKKTAAEISAILKIGQEAAQKRVSRAIEKLRGAISAQGLALSAGVLAALLSALPAVAVPAALTGTVAASAFASGGAATGIHFISTLKFIFMSKAKVIGVSALFVAGIATPLVVHHHMFVRLRQENSGLREELQEASLVRSDEADLQRQLSAAKAAQALSKAQQSELMRLRGEVGALRGDSQELARLRSRGQAQPNAGNNSAPASAYVPSEAWANLGTDKPESSVQTFFWAGKRGETNLVGNLLRWKRDAEIPASDVLDETFEKAMVSGATRFASEVQGIRLTSQDQTPDGEVRLGLEVTDKEGKARTHALRLVQEDGQWFPVMHVWLQEKGSVRGAMDIPDKFQPR